MTVLPGFMESICSGLGLFATEGRMRFLNEQARWEGGTAKYNPLNTTMPGGEDPAAPYYNTFGDHGQYHVRNYATFAAGVAATVATLQQQNFMPIRETLRLESYQPGLTANIRLWGTTGLADAIDAGWQAFTGGTMAGLTTADVEATVEALFIPLMRQLLGIDPSTFADTVSVDVIRKKLAGNPETANTAVRDHVHTPGGVVK